MAPLQFQPESKGQMVGVQVGLNAVGARVKGVAVGAGVGFEGQLVMPSLNSHSALASDFWLGSLDGRIEGCLDG